MSSRLLFHTSPEVSLTFCKAISRERLRSLPHSCQPSQAAQQRALLDPLSKRMTLRPEVEQRQSQRQQPLRPEWLQDHKAYAQHTAQQIAARVAPHAPSRPIQRQHCQQPQQDNCHRAYRGPATLIAYLHRLCAIPLHFLPGLNPSELRKQQNKYPMRSPRS